MKSIGGMKPEKVPVLGEDDSTLGQSKGGLHLVC
jgi:hypothetical protein